MERSISSVSRRSLLKTALGGALASSFVAPAVEVQQAYAQETTTPPTGIKPRARDLGVPFLGNPGPLNAITDVPGVTVGQVTLIEGEGPLIVGSGPVRTGITTVLPSATQDQVFGAWDALNGNGELTGAVWIEEMGLITGPILLTNSGSVGTVKDSVTQWVYQRLGIDSFFVPVVGETYNGILNDILGEHVTRDHVFAVLDEMLGRLSTGATAQPVDEGSVGGGTGMICHDFKGGIGTASRAIPYPKETTYTVGVLVQANQGSRPNLAIAGVPVGLEIPDLLPEISTSASIGPFSTSSIVVIVATDAPLLPHQLKRVAKRAGLGVGLIGGIGEDASGDIFLAFSTAFPGTRDQPVVSQVETIPNFMLDPLFYAAVHATEEAIVNALVAAETMTGINGNTVYGLPHDRLRDALKKYNRLAS